MPDTKKTVISEMLLIIDNGFQIIYGFTMILHSCSYICPLEQNSQQNQVMIVDISAPSQVKVCALARVESYQ